MNTDRVIKFIKGEMEELLEQVESIKNILVAHATGESPRDADYKALRAELVKNPLIKNKQILKDIL